MTRFDAPASSVGKPSAFRTVGRLAAARVGMLVAAFVPTVLALAGAAFALACGVAVPSVLQQAFVASPVLVFVSPTASRSDVEAIGRKLTAVPGVVAAALRPKEDALAALVASGLPTPIDGRNPLPDLWTVRLRGDGPSFTTEVVTARDAITAIPGIDRVRFDEAWAGGLDRLAAAWSRFGIGALAGVLVGVALSQFCIHVLLGRSLASSADTPPALSALLIVGVGLSLIAAPVGYAACIVVSDRFLHVDVPSLKPIAVAIGQSIGTALGAVASVNSMLSAIGIMFGGSDRTKRST